MRRRRARPPPPTPASVPTGGGAPAPSMAVLAAAPPFFGAHAGPAAAAAAAAPLFGAPAGPAAVPSAATPLLRAPAEALLPPPLLPRRLLAPPPGPLGFPPAAPAPAGGAVGALVGADPATPAPLFRAGGRATRGTASALVLSACSGSCAPPRSRGLPGPTAAAHPWQLSVRARTVRLPSPLAKVGLPARARARHAWPTDLALLFLDQLTSRSRCGRSRPGQCAPSAYLSAHPPPGWPVAQAALLPPERAPAALTCRWCRTWRDICGSQCAVLPHAGPVHA